MDAGAGVAHVVGVVEERGARRLLQRFMHRPAEEIAVLWAHTGASTVSASVRKRGGKKKTEGLAHLEGQDKDVFGFDLFLLHAGRGQVDILSVRRRLTSERTAWRREAADEN